MSIIDGMGGGASSHETLTRRELLKRLAGAAALTPFAGGIAISGTNSAGSIPRPGPRHLPPKTFSDQDDAFLQDMEAANFRYFWEQANPDTGIVQGPLQRPHPRQKRSGQHRRHGIWADRALHRRKARIYLPRRSPGARAEHPALPLEEAAEPSRLFLSLGQHQYRRETVGLRSLFRRHRHPALRNSHLPRSISSIPKSASWPTDIFNRVDWTWLSEDTSILPHGWRPESGFLQYRWDNYSEMMMMYLLGLGLRSHPLPAESWDAWKRTTFEYDGIRYIGSFAPLFVHQYSQAWFDFRGKRDKYADYFQNSVIATDVHRRFCIDLANAVPRLQRRSVGHHGFGFGRADMSSGAAARDRADRWNRVPCAAGGSLPFLPDQAMRVLRNDEGPLRKRRVEPATDSWTRSIR